MFYIKMNILLLGLILLIKNSYCINSYLYLSDKKIKEEIPVGSFISDLAQELDTNQLLKKQLTAQQSSSLTSAMQFTLLDDSKMSGNGFFNLDAATGILTTKRFLDRESMCANRQCAEPCELSHMHSQQHQQNQQQYGSCRINLKVLMMPSYNILNFNVYVEDINDNKPFFRSKTMTQQINENVPIGYKIPIELAYDPDIGANSIKFYEITDTAKSNKNINLIKNTFGLAYNANDSQLHLVVISKLDREKIPSYNFTISAFDGGVPPLNSSLNMLIDIVDINDNNPIFEKEVYKYSLREDTPVDTVICHLKANDLDEGLNGLVKYYLVDNSNNKASDRFVIQKGSVQTKQNLFKYFDLDETTGILRLKTPLDFEDESYFSLTVEARDSGVGSLPSYATVEINVLDVNDNMPEISVSFLNSLMKNASKIPGYKYDVYIPENTKTNKFIAHVSIIDKDSNENGRFDWRVLINNDIFFSSKNIQLNEEQSLDAFLLKLIKLNNNSFTLNVGSTQFLDREQNDYFNISIMAWDYGSPKLNQSIYNFTIRLIDINDNAPRFDRISYEENVYENNEPFERLFKLNAVDLDAPGPNSNITYSIKEPMVNDYLFIDYEGYVYAKVRLDREKIDKLVFNVIASDNGQPSLSTSVQVTLNILDLNDNHPEVLFNTSFYHQIYKKEDNSLDENDDDEEDNKIAYSIHIKIGQNVAVNTRLIDFRGNDADSNGDDQVAFFFDSASRLPFKLTSGGNFILSKTLEKSKQSLYEDMKIVCKDSANSGKDHSLRTTVLLTVEVIDTIDYCIKMFSSKIENDNESRTSFFNRDQTASKPQTSLITDILFSIDYDIPIEKLNKIDVGLEKLNIQSDSNLNFELLTHKDLIDLKTYTVDLKKPNNQTNNQNQQYQYQIEESVFKAQRLELTFKSTLTSVNISRLMLGKYTIKVKIMDNLNPTCVKVELFTLLIGNNFISKKEMLQFLQTFKQQKTIIIKNNTYLTNSGNKKVDNDNDYLINSKQQYSIKNEDEEYNANDEYNLNENGKKKPVSSVAKLNENEYLFSLNDKNNKLSLMKSDYILLFILIVIIVITSILFIFIGVICIYSRYKKQYNEKNKINGKGEHGTRTTNINNIDEEMDLATESVHLSANRYKPNKGGKKSSKKSSKKQLLQSTADLNISSASSTTSSNVNSDNININSHKPQYTLVNNKSSSSSSSSSCNAASNGTLIYRDADDLDEFGGLLSPPSNISVRQKQTNYQSSKQHHLHLTHHQQQHNLLNQRFIYSTLTHKHGSSGNNANSNSSSSHGYETNRSNSAAESIIDTTTIDDSKSNNSQNDVDLTLHPHNNLNSISSISHNNYSVRHLTLQNVRMPNLKTKSNQISEQSSAYGSIAYSEIEADSHHINSTNTKKANIDISNVLCSNEDETQSSATLKKNLDPNMLSFKKAVTNVKSDNTTTSTNINSNVNKINKASNNTNNNYTNFINNSTTKNYINPRLATLTRTSFNL